MGMFVAALSRLFGVYGSGRAVGAINGGGATHWASHGAMHRGGASLGFSKPGTRTPHLRAHAHQTPIAHAATYSHGAHGPHGTPPQRAARKTAPRKPLRIVHGKAGRLVISGRMADVCAELDRLAALEAQALAPAR